jgi:thiol:disulfide interchange protein DsbD
MAVTFACVGLLVGLFGAELNLQAKLQSPTVLILSGANFCRLGGCDVWLLRASVAAICAAMARQSCASAANESCPRQQSFLGLCYGCFV